MKEIKLRINRGMNNLSEALLQYETEVTIQQESQLHEIVVGEVANKYRLRFK